MKLMISLFLLLASLSATASEAMSFGCRFSDLTAINQFSVEGSVDFSEGKFEDAQFDFLLRKAGRASGAQGVSVTRDGTIQVFEAGSLHAHKTVRLASVVKGDYIEYINLLVDVPRPHTSQVRLHDGTTFFGTCYSKED